MRGSYPAEAPGRPEDSAMNSGTKAFGSIPVRIRKERDLLAEYNFYGRAVYAGDQGRSAPAPEAAAGGFQTERLERQNRPPVEGDSGPVPRAYGEIREPVRDLLEHRGERTVIGRLLYRYWRLPVLP